MNKTAERSNQGSYMTITSTNPLEGNMKRTEIHLSDPFDEVLASLLTLPSTHAEADGLHFPDTADSSLRKSAECDTEVKAALRSLYEAANGRQVETHIGFVGIAPPVADFLKQAPYSVNSQYEFFLEAFTRILTGDSLRKGRSNGSRKPDSKTAAESTLGRRFLPALSHAPGAIG